MSAFRISKFASDMHENHWHCARVGSRQGLQVSSVTEHGFVEHHSVSPVSNVKLMGEKGRGVDIITRETYMTDIDSDKATLLLIAATYIELPFGRYTERSLTELATTNQQAVNTLEKLEAGLHKLWKRPEVLQEHQRYLKFFQEAVNGLIFDDVDIAVANPYVRKDDIGNNDKVVLSFVKKRTRDNQIPDQPKDYFAVIHIPQALFNACFKET